MRIKITKEHYDSQKIKDFLDQLQLELQESEVSFRSVNIYIDLKNSDGDSVYKLENGSMVDFKTKYVKNENNEKTSEFVKWYKDIP